MSVEIDHARFVAMLAEQFPDIAADIDECIQGLLHMEMGIFAMATQKAISAEDVFVVRDHFAFIGDAYRRATPDVQNAIHVSYLERLSFEGRHAAKIKAREMLSAQLQDALRGVEDYNRELFRRKSH